MAIYSGGARSSGAGTSARPVGSLFAAASVGARLLECGFFNTTTTAVVVRLVRLTAVGTPGSGLTEAEWNPDGGAAQATLFDTHSADATVGEDLGFRHPCGAAIGSGVVFTFPEGIRISPGTGNGIGLVPVGTGQILDWYFKWEE